MKYSLHIGKGRFSTRGLFHDRSAAVLLAANGFTIAVALIQHWNLAALLLFLALKTVADLVMHGVEHSDSGARKGRVVAVRGGQT